MSIRDKLNVAFKSVIEAELELVDQGSSKVNRELVVLMFGADAMHRAANELAEVRSVLDTLVAELQDLSRPSSAEPEEPTH